MVKSILIYLLAVILLRPIHCRTHHVINFRWPDLYPESFAWDPKSDHFIVGSLRRPQLISVSDAGVASSLIHDDSLPPNSFFVGIAIDPRKRRVLTVVHRGSPPRSALAAYDLQTYRRLLLVPLDDLLPTSSAPVLANDVAADYYGNAYVTDSTNNVVFKITEQGQASILSRSQIFNPEDRVSSRVPYHNCGLNGVVYNSKGYLLVTQSNTGKLFKVNADDGTARRVLLNRDMTGADGIAVRKDGVVLVVSQKRMYFIKSDDSWSQGVVFDETGLDEEGQASAVVVGAESRAYALYGHVNEGTAGRSGREEFSIVQVESEEESKEEKIWIYVLIGLGLFWFTVWRFQMRKLVANIDKKVA